ncbi:hypothetical protein GB931_02930 [Modestobacter sp. I12A-02628]|uniref:Ankyrin repeat domain-containing protein n=1 Tax=Goekera deserti TaxID=2497753 RepID=A0A7K3WD94_9ACTN|nr:ankyrin repeat domain-containing protein [Goekera deserti]MPQ96892.1 hypothetical protein [Goekera deserti]NDI46795.1 hypothetical protein [Goekera deserti]NEL54364.1 ankyrin repeat domain-containing protein [Goekera deserti]
MTEDRPAQSLFEAVAAGDADAVRAAVAAGDSPAVRDGDDWSPLDHAAGRGDAQIVRILLDAGADPAAEGREQRSAYRIALAAGHVDAARVLRAALEAADPATAAQHQWRPYCRAYPIGRLRAAPGWRDDAADLDDAAIVFVHDDLTVTRDMWRDEDVLYADVSAEWTSFCAEQLGFAVPDDFDLVPDQKSGVI